MSAPHVWPVDLANDLRTLGEGVARRTLHRPTREIVDEVVGKALARVSGMRSGHARRRTFASILKSECAWVNSQTRLGDLEFTKTAPRLQLLGVYPDEREILAAVRGVEKVGGWPGLTVLEAGRLTEDRSVEGIQIEKGAIVIRAHVEDARMWDEAVAWTQEVQR